MESFYASGVVKFMLFSSAMFMYWGGGVYVRGMEYEVGGEKGWVKPSGNESETFNEWAQQQRFHVGDTLYFKYKKDSVLQVTKEHYESCNATNPISKFNNGNTKFNLDHSGFFFFISGNQAHCLSGQRLIIRVMVQSGVHHPIVSSPAPSPESSGGGGGDGGGDWWGDGYLSPTAFNSTDMLSVSSYFMTVLTGFLLVVYVFMN